MNKKPKKNPRSAVQFMNERKSGRDINIQTDRILKLNSDNSVVFSAKLFSHAGVPGENRLRLQQACSLFRDLQQACSRPVFNHTPARGLLHTRRLNKNITFIYKCLICGCAAGLLQACDQKQACYRLVTSFQTSCRPALIVNDFHLGLPLDIQFFSTSPQFDQWNILRYFGGYWECFSWKK